MHSPIVMVLWSLVDHFSVRKLWIFLSFPLDYLYSRKNKTAKTRFSKWRARSLMIIFKTSAACAKLHRWWICWLTVCMLCIFFSGRLRFSLGSWKCAPGNVKKISDPGVGLNWFARRRPLSLSAPAVASIRVGFLSSSDLGPAISSERARDCMPVLISNIIRTKHHPVTYMQ